MSSSPEPTSSRSVLLVVDDSPRVLECIQGLFAGETDVLCATSGEEALELSSYTLPDLILMDVGMPGMDGFETCRRFREHHAAEHPTLIFLSDLEDEASEARGLALGAIDYIRKPFNPDLLRAKVRNHLNAKAHQDAYKSMAFQDGTTGLPNRRSFDRTFAREWERAVRGGTELSLLMIDVDLFKQFNDHLGHAAGDRCLEQVASALESALPRRIDFLGRYGGDEFSAILPFTDQQGALAVAENMRAAVEALAIPAPFTPAGRVTVTLGSASMLPGLEHLSEQLVIRADKGLYNAKRNGRNRVDFARETGLIKPDPSPIENLEFLDEEDLDSDQGLPCILLVDDDSRVRELMEGRLACLGATIESLPGAHSASKLLARRVTDLILSDVVMPGVDGFEFCQRCKEDPRLEGVPFVLFTSISADLRERALGAGADDYLSKMEQEHLFRMRVRSSLELGINRASALAIAGGEILLMTKSAAIHDQISNQMAAMGILMRSAPGWKGLEALAWSGTDLLVLDAAMLWDAPRDRIRMLRDLGSPILVLASAGEDARLLEVELDFQDRLPKPLEAAEIRHRILMMLRLAQARRSPRLLARWSAQKDSLMVP